MATRLLNPGCAKKGKAFDCRQRLAGTPSLFDGVQGGEGPRVFAIAQQCFESHQDVAVTDLSRRRFEHLKDGIGTPGRLAPISPSDRDLGQINIQANMLGMPQ